MVSESVIKQCAQKNVGSPRGLNPHIGECGNLSLLAVDLEGHKWYHNQSSSGVPARTPGPQEGSITTLESVETVK